MALDELEGLDPLDPVELKIVIGHEVPLEAGAVGALLESLSVLDLMTHWGEQSDSTYLDEIENRWRIRSSEDLLPSTPRILATDADFIITLATVAAVAGIVAGVAAVVQCGSRCC